MATNTNAVLQGTNSMTTLLTNKGVDNTKHSNDGGLNMVLDAIVGGNSETRSANKTNRKIIPLDEQLRSVEAKLEKARNNEFKVDVANRVVVFGGFIAMMICSILFGPLIPLFIYCGAMLICIKVKYNVFKIIDSLKQQIYCIENHINSDNVNQNSI